MNVLFNHSHRLHRYWQSSSLPINHVKSFQNRCIYRYIHYLQPSTNVLPKSPNKSNTKSSYSYKMHPHLIYFDIARSFCNKPETNDPNNTKNDETSLNTEQADNNPETPITKKDDDKIDRRVYPIAFSSLLMGIGIGVILPVMPQFANEVGINTMQYGLVISVMGITRLLMNIPAGLLSDIVGRKPTLVGGPLVSSLGQLVLVYASSFSGMITSRVVTGAGGSVQMAGAQAYLSDISTVKNRQRTMAPLIMAFSAGAALGPVVGGFLCDYYDSVRVPFVFVACAMATVAINNMIMLPETLKKKDRKNRNEINLKSTVKNMLSEWKTLISNKSHLSGVFVHTSFWFTHVGGCFTLLPLFATNHLSCSASQIGYIFMMMSIINVAGSQPFAWIADKYGRKKVIIPSTIIIASCMPLIPFCSTINHLYSLIFIYSLGATMLGSSPTAYISDLHKTDKRSQALAMTRSGGDLGVMCGSGLLGYLAYMTDSFEIPMCTASVLLFASGINFSFNAKETVIRD